MRLPVFAFRGARRCIVAAAGLVLAFAIPGLANAQEAPSFTITDDATAAYYAQYGGADTFGAPISQEFTLFGQPVQLFQNGALALQADGSVQPMQLTGDGLLPYANFDGLTVPSADPSIAFVAPTPDQPDYDARLQVFLQAEIGTQFQAEYDATGGTAVWGLPTSSAVADPHNPNFVYQRFQNGILFYDATSGTTQPLPLGEYMEEILTGQNLPSDLATEAATSPLHAQTVATTAFVPDAA